MGAVIMFPRVRRGLGKMPMADIGAVIILPVIRIERAYDKPPGAETETAKSPSGRKRRKRVAPNLRSPASGRR